ncbi:glycosyltransferase [Microvirga roseola]|uniref:glycosyltransferase n=1 Tax=Microvirga roseola TaxID=2883126 RepID=UPI001E35B9B6|nr:glycosyltransferase [Microvirga roseola]
MGGEDVVFDSESRALEARGFPIERFILDNASIRSLPDKVRAAVNVSDNRKSVSEFKRALAEFQPDVVQVHNFFPLLTPGALAVAAEAGIPVVQTLHNYRALCANGMLFRNGGACTSCASGSYLSGILHRCYRDSAIGSLAVGRMGGRLKEIARSHPQLITFIAMTEFSKALFVANGFDERQIVVKNHSIADPGEEPRPRGRRILFVGRLSPEKGADLLCRIAAQIDAEFAIIGGGPEFDALSRSKPHNLTLLGPLPREDVFTQMRMATAVLVPSRWYEIGPLTILEAFATGTPVIAPSIGTPAELIVDGVTGLLADPNDDSAWKRAIEKLLLNPGLARDIGQNGRRAYLERFTEQTSLDRLIDIYAWAIGRSKAEGRPLEGVLSSKGSLDASHSRHAPL